MPRIWRSVPSGKQSNWIPGRRYGGAQRCTRRVIRGRVDNCLSSVREFWQRNFRAFRAAQWPSEKGLSRELSDASHRGWSWRGRKLRIYVFWVSSKSHHGKASFRETSALPTSR